MKPIFAIAAVSCTTNYNNFPLIFTIFKIMIMKLFPKTFKSFPKMGKSVMKPIFAIAAVN